MPRLLALALLSAATAARADDARHWAFVPPKATAPPAVKNAAWPRSDADRFLLAAMEKRGLAPVADASPAALIRRLTFDLTGLPPTPAEVAAFEQSALRNPQSALEQAVDRLLASPAFGEHWGRRWLDVARFAESSGKEQNLVYSQAWRYRDWVIAAFNRDLPYPDFVRRQLAGDLLPAANPTERGENIVATGYLALGPKSHNERVPLQFRLDVADEQIDAFTQGILGVTVACARCHDHKFDPVSQEEYAALAGIFTSTNTLFGTPVLPQARNGAPLADLPADADLPAGSPLSPREVLARKALLASLEKQLEEARSAARRDGQPPVQLLLLNGRVMTLEATLANFHPDGAPRMKAMAAADRVLPRDGVVYKRGETTQPGDRVPRGVPADLGGPAFPAVAAGSGRKELAEWATHPAHPLTARVWVNRVWGHLFGAPLMATPDNFGVTGAAPTHPELLDTLAARFAAGPGSTKRLIRELVLSRAYGLSSDPGPATAAKSADPDAAFRWRMPRRRLPAEAIRDAMLAASGELDPKPPLGSPVAAFEGPVQVLERLGRRGAAGESDHRSVYLPVIRNQVPESLELFDFAEPSLVTGKREETSVPAQALYLMNNPRVLELAERFAARLKRDGSTPQERVKLAFRLAFGREPSAAEAEASWRYIRSAAKRAGEPGAWAAFCQGLFCAAEFRFVS